MLTGYFEKNGSRKFGADESPAEVMLGLCESFLVRCKADIVYVIGAAPGSETTIDWPQVWNDSPERQTIKAALAEMKVELSQKPIDHDPTALDPFTAPLTIQLWTVTLRVFEQYLRTPSYLYSKTALCIAVGLFIGLSFWQSPNSLQGMQNQLFSIFMLLTVFGNLYQQIMPHFVTQRDLYEARERPSKTYSWKVFILSNIIVEMPWNTLMGVLTYFCWYYPIGFYRNAEPTGQVASRGGLMFLSSGVS
jgi:ATP-binding cassette subfamily G (WHITE) protein 2 (PDR)